MNCDEKISQCYEGIIACQAQAILERLEKICIRELQKCKRDSGKMTSEEDSGLENLWDEICVQVQGESSIFWDAYEEYVASLISTLLLNRCSENERKMLWFQTDEFNDWYTEVFQDEERLSQRFFKDGMPDGYSEETVTKWCLSQMLSVAANYTNARSNRYLSGGYELG